VDRDVRGRCRGCGALLSRFNPRDRCAACQREPSALADPRFWDDPEVRQSLGRWDLGTVVRLFRQHTGLSQHAVGRLVSIDQAEVSRLERGQKAIRDRRQLSQWASALGAPASLIGILPDGSGGSESPTPSYTLPGAGSIQPSRGGPRGAGQLVLPRGRQLDGAILPTVTLPAEPAEDNRAHRLLLDPGELGAWLQAPTRALLVAVDTFSGRQRLYAVDSREARRLRGTGPSGGRACVSIPDAYELDDLTYGILWAVAAFDAGLLDDDWFLHDGDGVLRHVDPDRAREASSEADVRATTRMFVGSEFCARYILSELGSLAEVPVFWTREQCGEEAATWLFFRHKFEYLRRTSEAVGEIRGGGGRAFCIPEEAVVTSPRHERLLLFLAIALMEAFGIPTFVCTDRDYAETDGFVLAEGDRAIIASWVRVGGASRVATSARSGLLRAFADAATHARHGSATAAPTAGDRVRATAEFLGLDRNWLHRRCADLTRTGTRGIAEPRSRFLSLDALEVACRYVAEQLRPTTPGPSGLADSLHADPTP
jgi:transcriptional regulator with XRE-family HTH domain